MESIPVYTNWFIVGLLLLSFAYGGFRERTLHRLWMEEWSEIRTVRSYGILSSSALRRKKLLDTLLWPSRFVIVVFFIVITNDKLVCLSRCYKYYYFQF